MVERVISTSLGGIAITGGERTIAKELEHCRTEELREPLRMVGEGSSWITMPRDAMVEVLSAPAPPRYTNAIRTLIRCESCGAPRYVGREDCAYCRTAYPWARSMPMRPDRMVCGPDVAVALRNVFLSTPTPGQRMSR